MSLCLRKLVLLSFDGSWEGRFHLLDLPIEPSGTSCLTAVRDAPTVGVGELKVRVDGPWILMSCHDFSGA